MAQRHRREFKNLCFHQVHRGLVNQADGTWKEAKPDSQMAVDMQAGYKLGGRLRRPKKEKKAS